MTELEFVCEKYQIEREVYCLLLSKELHNELKNALKDANNHLYQTDKFKTTDELGNIFRINIETDKGFGKDFEVRIKPDEKEAE